MSLNTQIIIYLFIYFIFIVWYSIFISRKQTEEDFLISSRNRNWFSIWMSKYATSIWAAWFITYTAYIYEFWLGVFSVVIWYVVAMFILAFYITPKLYKISKKEKFLKMWDIVFFKTKNKLAERIANISSTLIIFVWLLVVVVWWANLISYFGILSYEVSLLSILSIVLLYLYFIWYKWVVTTDILQSSIIVLVLLVVSYYLFNKSDLAVLANVEFKDISTWTVIGFLVYGIFSTFSFIDRYQVMFSWADEKNIKKWFIFAVPLMLLSVVLLLIIWYFVKSEITNLDSSLVFLKAIELYLPQTFIPIAMVMFFAAVMSSIDSYVYWISSHINILKTKDKIKSLRVNALMTVLVSFIFAYFIRNIIDITVFAAWFSLVLSVPMIYLFWGKDFVGKQKNISRFIFSFIFSIIGLIVWISIFWLTPTIALFPILFGGIGLFINFKKLNSY